MEDVEIQLASGSQGSDGEVHGEHPLNVDKEIAGEPRFEEDQERDQMESDERRKISHPQILIKED